MPPIPGFCGPTYQAISPNIDAELAINLFCEHSESGGAKSQIPLILAPGKKLFASLPEAGITSEFNINGRGFVAGAHLWELNANGTFTDRGPLGGAQPVRPCQMEANETQLLCLNNGNLYVLILATNVLTAVTMSQLQGGPNSVAQIGFADGFFFAWFLNTHTFQMSSLEDGTTWSGLDVATVSLFPDNFVSMKCDHREAWFFSAKKSAGYYNSGAGFPSYIPIQGAFAEFGAGAMAATVQADNTIAWIGQDERGGAVAYRLNGYANQRISTHAVEFAWQSYATIADARGFSYQEDGHTFWQIYFPTANATWVYDFSTEFWHQRGAWNAVGGYYDADHAQCHMFIFGKHLVGDWASGNIYEQSTSIYTDNGGILRGLRRSPTANKDNKWIYFDEFELDIEAGLGPQPPLVDDNGNPRPPQVMLRWSNDGAKTWSSTFLLNCGFAGQTNARARKSMLGRARKRVWEIAVTDPIAWRIANAYVKASASLEAA
jgi:hypothetical protein